MVYALDSKMSLTQASLESLPVTMLVKMLIWEFELEMVFAINENYIDVFFNLYAHLP